MFFFILGDLMQTGKGDYSLLTFSQKRYNLQEIHLENL